MRDLISNSVGRKTNLVPYRMHRKRGATRVYFLRKKKGTAKDIVKRGGDLKRLTPRGEKESDRYDGRKRDRSGGKGFGLS